MDKIGTWSFLVSGKEIWDFLRMGLGSSRLSRFNRKVNTNSLYVNHIKCILSGHWQTTGPKCACPQQLIRKYETLYALVKEVGPTSFGHFYVIKNPTQIL